LVQKHTNDPVQVRLESTHADLLEHGLVRVDREQKLPTLSKLLRKHGGSAIIFGRTKHGVTKLNQNLRKLGHNSVELQGNLSQLVRDRAMSSFREGRSTILVATNVAARGIDVNNVGLVVNFELPDSPQWLTHRVGRTARMGEAGRALTFVSPEDEGAWVKLGRLGAPIIRELDTKRLLDEGSWHYQEGRPMQSRGPSSAPRGANRNRGRRPWHSGGGTGGGRPSSGNSNGSGRPRQST
jgi:superfamily II DNA/RNA helicase